MRLIRSSNSSASSPKSPTLLAVALTVATLYFGRQIFIPLALALVLSFLLTPLVSLLEKARLGRVPSVLCVIALCLALTGLVGWGVAGQLLEIMANVSKYKSNLQEKVQSLRSPQNNPLGQATASVRELNRELATSSNETSTGPGQNSSAPGQTGRGQTGDEPKISLGSSRPIPVRVTAPPSNLVQDVTTLLGPLAGPVETTGIVIVFTVFTLIKREDLRNRLIRLGGEGRLHVMTQALDDASQGLSRYLWLQFLVNVCYGTLFGTGLYLIGVPHAFLWGAIETLLRFAPYIGTLLGAAFPVTLALAVFPGWHHALLAFALFLILEIVVANGIEPWLYGSNVGISSFAILVAAVFWTMLWGLPGLILSTPVTLCLMLAGRYVPRLDFLQVVLGDEPVLKPEQHFYQRLLAMDPDEARNIAEAYLRENPLESLYENVFIPALSLAEQDRHMDAIDDRVSEVLYQNVRELIEDLGDRFERQASEAASADVGKGPHLEDIRDQKPRVMCVPARDNADELVGMMLAQLLWQSGSNAVHLSIGTVHDMLEQVSQENVRVVCVSALPPFAVGQARSLCKRMRAKFPHLEIVVGLWNFSGGVPKAQERIGRNNSDAVATTLAEAILQIRRLTQLALLEKTGNSQETTAQFRKSRSA